MKTSERIELENDKRKLIEDIKLLGESFENGLEKLILQDFLTRINYDLDNDEDYIPFNPNQLKLFS